MFQLNTRVNIGENEFVGKYWIDRTDTMKNVYEEFGVVYFFLALVFIVLEIQILVPEIF